MRKLVLLSIKILLSAALLYFALSKVDFAALWSRLNAHSIKWLVLATAVLFVQLCIAAVRWREISKYCNAPLTMPRAIRFAMIGAFFNQTLPSSIGGDAVRLVLVSRAGAGWRAAAYSVFVDRAVGLIALAVIVVLSLPWSYELIDSVHGRTTLIIIDMLALGAGLGFLALSKITWKRLRAWRPAHHLVACSSIANRMLFSRESGLWVVVLSMVVHVLTVVTVWCVAQSISTPVSFLNLFLLILPVVLISLLPISIAGWGLRETAMMVAFGYAGLSQSAGVNISLLFGAVTFLLGIFGGPLWIGSPDRRLDRHVLEPADQALQS